MVSASILQSYASVLSYPAGRGLDSVRTSIEDIVSERPSLGNSLGGLLQFIEEHPEKDLEEIFTTTFDSNTERALEVGWHIHGENYARGVFMARMRGLLRELGIEESSELPDHISHVLLVLAKAKPELSAALAGGVVVQALGKIVEGFPNSDNPYREVIAGLKAFLEESSSDE
ncbi:MAG: nitrate reductase assembly molybdenum cofactor insertion protein NarJ [Planctomycetota bacterium]|jgi:nitrate reductase assembly molybdenum cofactor insertion protein NarJ